MKDKRLEGKLTRYLSFNRYVSFLSDGLFLSNAKLFEDPWEGQVYFRITAPPDEQKNLAAFVADRKKFIYISCWHAAEEESYAMWKIYGKEDAVAIHTNGQKLKTLLQDIYKQHKVKPILLTPVEYCSFSDKSLPNISKRDVFSISYNDDSNDKKIWFDAMQQFFMHKPIAYKFEQEVRIIALDKDAPNFLEVLSDYEEKSGIIVSINPRDFVESVTIAPWADSAFVNAVKAVSKKFGIPESIVKKSKLFDNPI